MVTAKIQIAVILMRKIYKILSGLPLVILIALVQFSFANMALAKIALYDKATHISSTNIQELEKWFDEDTIILITLEDVLIRPNYMMFSYESPYRNFIANLESKAMNNRSYARKLVSWYGQRKMVLMEEGWINFIETAKSKGAKVYGFCRMPIEMKDIEKYKYVELFNLGVQFTQTAGDQNVIALSKKRDWLSVFYQGVIYPGASSMRVTIENFMKLSMIAPKKILYFSSRYSDLYDLDVALREFDIDLKNIEYRAIEKYTPEMNLDVIRFQQQYFFKTLKMLDDNEAAQMMLKLSEEQGK